jgi:riboflavin biosynthesis pyrimidine reductase
LCMVASIDGGTVVGGTSRALGSPADASILLGVRDIADMIIVGAGTVRAEGYGPARKAGQRIGVVSTQARGLDPTTPLFTSGSGFVITTEDAGELPIDSVRAGTGHVDLRAAVRQLDVTFIQGEGGAGLNGSLFDADLIDEVNLTLSPHVVGGDSVRVLHGAAGRLARFELRHVLEDDGFLFTRYVRR